MFPRGESGWAPKKYELVEPLPFRERLREYMEEDRNTDAERTWDIDGDYRRITPRNAQPIIRGLSCLLSIA